jgi:hypothetical protein
MSERVLCPYALLRSSELTCFRVAPLAYLDFLWYNKVYGKRDKPTNYQRKPRCCLGKTTKAPDSGGKG